MAIGIAKLISIARRSTRNNWTSLRTSARKAVFMRRTSSFRLALRTPFPNRRAHLPRVDKDGRDPPAIAGGAAFPLRDHARPLAESRLRTPLTSHPVKPGPDRVEGRRY